MHIKNINIHLGNPAAGSALLAALFASSAMQEEPAKSASILVPPAIGEYWPGQGGIYVGVGRGRDGAKDHCLILPTDPRATFTNRMLGTKGIDVPNAGSDHDGPTNTASLAGAGSELCQEILALEIEGHRDFYLMSRTDAQLCWANVSEQFKKEWHLTSTQYSSGSAWYQDFGSGFTSSFIKSFEASARACRRLFL